MIQYKTENSFKDTPAEEISQDIKADSLEDISADEETEQAGDAADTAAEEAETLVSSLPKEQLVQAGVNVKMGLGYCCGEEEFYLEMLRMFCAQSEEKS